MNIAPEVHGNEDSEPLSRPELHERESGDLDSPYISKEHSDDLQKHFDEPSYNAADKKSADKEELNDAERTQVSGAGAQSAQASSENSSRTRSSDAVSKNGEDKKGALESIGDAFSGLAGKKKLLFGGGISVTAIAGAIFFTTLLQGPLQFIHLAQLMERFHFSNQQNQQDNRFAKEVRFFRFVGKGQIERTRMGFVGNKITDSYEKKLKVTGLKSSYSDVYGLFDGWVVDRTSVDSPFHGMSKGRATLAAKTVFGIAPVEGSSIVGGSAAIKDELVFDASKMGFREALSFNYGLLKPVASNRVSAALGARLFCVRAACNWHPLSKKVVSTKRAIEDFIAKTREARRKGQQALKGQVSDTKKSGTPDQNAQRDASGQLIDELGAQSDAASKDPTKIAALKGKLYSGVTGGLAAAAGVLCLVQGINHNADSIKQAQIIEPAIRTAMETISTGGASKHGQDANLAELGALSKQLNGIDSRGVKSSWIQSQSIQANLGNANTGVPPNGTLKSIGQGSPFDFVNSIPGLDQVCSVFGQAILGVISIAIDGTGYGAIPSAIISSLVIGVIQGPVGDEIAHWLAGSPLDVAANGADFGNIVDFGSVLAANQQAVTAGGAQLSTAQSAELQNASNLADAQEFNKQSTAYKIFNARDQRSALAKLIDNTSPSVSQNTTKLAASFLNVGHIFSSLPKLFTAKASAAVLPVPYNYGFKQMGFSVEEMDNKTVENPYQNACQVVGCPDADPAKDIKGFMIDSATNKPVTLLGDKYISRADKCFGVSIEPDADGRWGVKLSPGPGPKLYDSGYGSGDSDCGNKTDPNWLKLRFFIMDTETMNSMGCYEGDPADVATSQACNDIGFGTTAAAATSSTVASTSVTIDDQAAQQVAKSDTSGAKVGYAVYTADGQPAAEFNDVSPNFGASITKSMLLVAYLNQVNTGTLSDTATTNLTKMIEESDNTAANWVYSHLNNGVNQVQSVARAAGMNGFELNTSDPLFVLGQSKITAQDFALFFSKIDTQMPASQKDFGMKLLSNLAAADQNGLLLSGLPPPIYSKEGWKSEPAGSLGAPYIVNQAAQFSSGGKTYGVAVTVGGTTDQATGEALIQKIVSALVKTN